MRRSVFIMMAVATGFLFAALGFVAYRFAFKPSAPQVALSPKDRQMQDELSMYLRQLPPEYAVTLSKPDAFDLPTRLCLARSNVLLEGLTREKLAAKPFDESALADFEAELSTYTPLKPDQPDSNEANLASTRASSAITTFFISWACVGPFSAQTRQAWVEYAEKLSVDTDLEVRQQCALLLWTVSNLPDKTSLSPASAKVLETLRSEPFIKDRWSYLISETLKPRVERAGRTWPSGL